MNMSSYNRSILVTAPVPDEINSLKMNENVTEATVSNDSSSVDIDNSGRCKNAIQTDYKNISKAFTSLGRKFNSMKDNVKSSDWKERLEKVATACTAQASYTDHRSEDLDSLYNATTNNNSLQAVATFLRDKFGEEFTTYVSEHGGSNVFDFASKGSENGNVSGTVTNGIESGVQQ